MRTGINPNKKKGIEPKIKEVTVGVLVNIPNSDGYYENAIEVMKQCLHSAKANTKVDFDLLVVDNNSSKEVKNILNEFLEQGLIRYLILNESNVGRPNGVRQVLDFSPGKYVGYADCDIYFKENWLEKELELLTRIPNTGFVSGMPCRSFTDYFTSFTQSYVKGNDSFSVEEGKLIPEEYLISFAQSLGYEDVNEVLGIWDKNHDVKIVYDNLTAYVGASHMHFMTTKELVKKLPEKRFEKLFGCNDEIIDKYVDEYNYMRLSTEIPVIHHMGNKPYSVNELFSKSNSEKNKQRNNFISKFYRRIIAKIYDWSFKKYYKAK